MAMILRDFQEVLGIFPVFHQIHRYETKVSAYFKYRFGLFGRDRKRMEMSEIIMNTIRKYQQEKLDCRYSIADYTIESDGKALWFYIELTYRG